MKHEKEEWYAAGDNIARTGPFAAQREAWESMRLTEDQRGSSPYPKDTRVWPEWVENEE